VQDRSRAVAEPETGRQPAGDSVRLIQTRVSGTYAFPGTVGTTSADRSPGYAGAGDCGFGAAGVDAEPGERGGRPNVCVLHEVSFGRFRKADL
jgi:hypothetical protein